MKAPNHPFSSLLLACAPVLAPACQQGHNTYSIGTDVSTSSVTGGGQPESVLDPRTGAARQAAPGEVVMLSTAGVNDLRPDAPKKQAQTAPNPNLDPRTYAPSGTYTPGGGRPTRNLLAGRIAVVSDGKASVPPVCGTAIAAPGVTATTGLAVDGNLTDWPAGAVIAVDRQGDIASPDLDLRAVYFAADAATIFLAVNLQSGWLTTNDGTRELIIDFQQINAPADATVNPTPGIAQRFYVRGNELWTSAGKVVQGTGAGQIAYALASAGTALELSLPKAAIGPAQSAVYSVSVSTHDIAHDTYDRTGLHIVGLTNDYACLVPLSGASGTYDHFKMVVFRRAATVDGQSAEVAYRSFIAAMQAFDYVQDDHLAPYDTLAVTVMPMASNYLVDDRLGLYLKDGAPDAFGDAGSSRELFRISAEMIGKLYSYFDYKLPHSFGREGYARAMTYQTLASYYGYAAGQFERYRDASAFLAEEAANPTATKTIDDDRWSAAPFSASFYVEKAAAYWDLTRRLVSPADLLTKILQVGRSGVALTDGDAFMAQLKDRRSYTGAASDDLAGGWLAGDYPGSALPLALLADDDADGLFAYQEKDLGSDPTLIDSDFDGVSDFADVALGLSPTKAHDLHMIVADNYLGDWELLMPGQLKTTLATQSTDPACTDAATLTRYGAIYSEGWLIGAAELKMLPTAAQGISINVTVTLASGATMSAAAVWGTQYYAGTGTTPAMLRAPAPFVGRTVEIALNASALGWSDGKLPAGTTVTFATAATGGKVLCDTTAAIAPATALP